MLRSTACVSAVLLGCSPRVRHVEVPEVPSIVAIVDADSVETRLVGDGPVEVSAESEAFIVVVPMSAFSTPELVAPSGEGVRARSRALGPPPRSCGECLLGMRRPQLVQPGDACPIPDGVALVFDREGSRLATQDERSVAERLVLDWPGPCACSDLEFRPARGPPLLPEGAERYASKVALRGDHVYVAGRHVVRDVVLDGSTISEAAVRDGFEEQVKFVFAPADRDEIFVGTQINVDETGVRALRSSDLGLLATLEGPPMEIDSAGMVGDLLVLAGQGRSFGTFTRGVVLICRLSLDQLECQRAVEVVDPNSRFTRLTLDRFGAAAAIAEDDLTVIPKLPSPESIVSSGRIVSSDSTRIQVRSAPEIPVWVYSGYDFAGLPVATSAGFLICGSARGTQNQGDLMSLLLELPTSSVARGQEPRPELAIRGTCPRMRCIGAASGPNGPFLLAAPLGGDLRMLRVSERGDLVSDCEGEAMPVSPLITIPTLERTIVQSEDGSIDAWTDAEVTSVHRSHRGPIVTVAETSEGFLLLRASGGLESISMDGSLSQNRLEGGDVRAAARRDDGAFVIVRVTPAEGPNPMRYSVELALPRADQQFERVLVGEGTSEHDGPFEVVWVSASTAVGLLPGSKLIRITQGGLIPIDVTWDSAATEVPDFPPMSGNQLENLEAAGGLAWATTRPKGIVVEVDVAGAHPTARRLHLTPSVSDPSLEAALKEPWILSFRAECPGRILMSWSGSRGLHVGASDGALLRVRPLASNADQLGRDILASSGGPLGRELSYVDHGGAIVTSHGTVIGSTDMPVLQMISTGDSLLAVTRFDAYLFRREE
ncbi:MAG: hypothetical protein HYV07_05695 [Deltaproteobacteria bacterium]|nr:hypothetical protein [Deltaproteobacteria bacterium]